MCGVKDCWTKYSIRRILRYKKFQSVMCNRFLQLFGTVKDKLTALKMSHSDETVVIGH